MDSIRAGGIRESTCSPPPPRLDLTLDPPPSVRYARPSVSSSVTQKIGGSRVVVEWTCGVGWLSKPVGNERARTSRAALGGHLTTCSTTSQAGRQGMAVWTCALLALLAFTVTCLLLLSNIHASASWGGIGSAWQSWNKNNLKSAKQTIIISVSACVKRQGALGSHRPTASTSPRGWAWTSSPCCVESVRIEVISATRNVH